jgi:mevalonate kinase
MSKPWTTQTTGKWILCGEHSVLRGHPALVLPVPSCSLDVSYEPGEEPLHAEFSGESAQDYQLLFWGVVEEGLKRLHHARADLKGSIVLKSTLPLGSGLGASAALCVSVARFFVHLGWLRDQDVYEFARSLEDLFHGESSGVDIAVALSGRPIRFLRSGDRQELEIKWKPHWYISPCGERGVTSECVAKVKRRFAVDRQQAEALDLKMAEAVQLAERALKSSKSDGLPLLIKAIETADSCFRQWGLVEGALHAHLEALNGSGALASKPTGSGGGGFTMSLWADEPTPEIQAKLNLIPI